MSDSSVDPTCFVTEDNSFVAPSPCEIMKRQTCPDIEEIVQWAWEHERYPHLINPRFRDEVIGESLLPDLWLIVCSYFVHTKHVYFSIPVSILPILSNKTTACNARITPFYDFCGLENNESIDIGNFGRWVTIRGMYCFPCDLIPYNNLEIRLASTNPTTRIVYRCWINWMEDYKFPPSKQKLLILWNTEVKKTYVIPDNTYGDAYWMSTCWHIQKDQKFYDYPFVLSGGSMTLLDKVDM